MWNVLSGIFIGLGVGILFLVAETGGFGVFLGFITIAICMVPIIFQDKEDRIKTLVSAVIMFAVILLWNKSLENQGYGTQNNDINESYQESIETNQSDMWTDEFTDNNDYVDNNHEDYVSPDLGSFTYSLSEVGNLDGYFCLDPSREILKQVHAKMQYEYHNKEILFLNEKELTEYLYVGYTDFAPITVDRTQGEILVMVGSTWDGRSENRKKEMEFYTCELWGYGNPYFLPQTMDLSEFEEVNGREIASMDGNIEAINDALADTPIQLYVYSEMSVLKLALMQNYPLFLSSKCGETFTFGSYSGTEYIEQNVAMITPYYQMKMNESATVVPINKTKEGYMIVDISSLEAGMWMIDNIYPIIVK